MSDLMQTHRDLLDRWRNAMNLVGPGAIDVHFDDCTRALAGIQPQGHWVDLGSGAGFPGLVLAALWPKLTIELVDSRKKRCVFLEQVLAAADVPADRVRVRRMRVEDLEGPYDGLVARAFAPPDRVVGLALQLLREGGLCVLFLQDGAPIPVREGLEVFHVEHYEVEGKQRMAATLKRLGP